MRFILIFFCLTFLHAAEQYDKVLTNLPEEDIRGALIGHQIEGGDTYYVFIHKEKGKTYGVGEYQAKGGKPVRLERVALTPDQINRIDRYFLWMTRSSVFTNSSRPLPPQWFYATCGEFPWRKA